MISSRTKIDLYVIHVPEQIEWYPRNNYKQYIYLQFFHIGRCFS